MFRLVVLSVLLVACGSDPPKNDDDGDGGPTRRETCPDGPGYGDGNVLVDSGSVRATIVDADGAPVVDLMVFVCGTRVCSMPEYTDADGAVTIASPEPMEKPAFKYGDGLEVGRFAALLSENAGETDLGTIGTPRLPASGARLTRGTTVESGAVRLTLAEDAVVEVLPIDYPEPDDRAFRAAELPLELAPPGLDAGEGLDAIFALAPTGAVVCPAASIELPNTPGYDPGTTVDILVHGTDVEEQWVPYGGWRTVATGRVDETGERIETIEGGLPVISNVGVRAR